MLFCFSQSSDLLRTVKPLTSLVILDLSACCAPAGLQMEGLKTIFTTLIKLEKLDLSGEFFCQTGHMDRLMEIS